MLFVSFDKKNSLKKIITISSLQLSTNFVKLPEQSIAHA